MLTKPCGRADRGCRRLIRESQPGRLRRRKMCSPACVRLDNIESGRWPAKIPGGVSKPCKRASKGCTGVVRAPGPKQLARIACCGHRCAALERMDNGWTPKPVLTKEARRLAAQKGAKQSAETRRREAVLRAVAKIEPLIPKSMDAALSYEDQKRLRLLLGKSFRLGMQLKYRQRRGLST